MSTHSANLHVRPYQTRYTQSLGVRNKGERRRAAWEKAAKAAGYSNNLAGWVRDTIDRVISYKD